MTINSYGYQVASLNELIEELTARRDADPQLGDKPVWIKNFGPVIPPILRVNPETDAHGLTLTVQRGYDR